jgi:hypothetical protein
LRVLIKIGGMMIRERAGRREGKADERWFRIRAFEES